MPRINRPAPSPLSDRQYPELGPELSKLSPEEIWQVMEMALMKEDYPRALEALDAAPRWMKRQSEYILARATVLASMGDDLEALKLLLEVERKDPRFTPVYLPMAMIYYQQDWLSHALQAARRALSNRELSDEQRALLDDVIREATAFIQQHADEHGLSFEMMQRAGIFNEKAQLAMDWGRLSEVDNFAKETIKLAPNWNAPHNNRARALYFSGRTSEAIAISEAVLERDPQNGFALYSLVVYHLGLGQEGQARDYANRLVKLSKSISEDKLDTEQVISALALVEDTAELWKFARRYLDELPDVLVGRSWAILAVAAVRSGKWKDALTLIEKSTGEAPAPHTEKLQNELKATASQRKPRLPWMPPEYPFIDVYMTSRIIEEWEAIFKNITGDMTPAQLRKLENFFQKYPFMHFVVKRMLWAESTFLVGLDLLKQLGTPEADAEILRFAFSQTGPQRVRSTALLALVQVGRYTGPKRVELWDEVSEEWHDVELNTQQIGEIEVNIQPKTMALLERARKSKNPNEAIALLRKAVEMEPTSPMAVFNLGVMLAQNGQVEEGEALIYRSVEVDPNYTYGHASIALTEAERGNERAAQDHLAVVTRAKVIAPETAFFSNLAFFRLALEKHDMEAARSHLDMAAHFIPEHPFLDSYEEMLKEAEKFHDQYGFLLEYQQESNRKAHQKLLKTPLTANTSLHTALGTYTKDMLVGVAHFLQAASSGKKGELVSRLADFLLDEAVLRDAVMEGLDEREREALRWLLETDGVRSWKDFARTYGSDEDESKFWIYHEPKSVLGRLRRAGLVITGTLDGAEVTFIPADVRPLLHKLL